METIVEVDFEGMTPIASVRSAIEAGVERLEKRFGRITACRVVVKGPGGHHRTSGLYEVRVWLSLPDGRQVAAARTPPQDERYGDLSFAVNDAFKRARRRLREQVRRMDGKVKTHEGEPIGTVTKLDDGFGFLQTSDGREIYFNANSVLNGAFARLKAGTRVTFAEEAGEKGPQASTVRLLGQHGMRQ
ncbi:MAG: cold shock domain-containing protein [Roseiarcus sp.]